ncbi:Spo0E family sporulation regulatory protein-aspartic acid phosphatase [Bacillus sp. A17A.1]
MLTYQKLNQIIQKQAELILLVKQHGLTHEKVIDLSNEVDLLVCEMLKIGEKKDET